MKIAVASGKGGTGKTTVSLALAETLGERGQLLDCDVEEPNCHLFLSVEAFRRHDVTVKIPRFNEELCTGCGVCSHFCAFHAIAGLGRKQLLFPELCHSCGGCAKLCPAHAITEESHVIGSLEYRHKGAVDLISGVMDVGNTMAVPVIRAVTACADAGRTCILDSPPGTACPMVATVQSADLVIFVTEPTPFGHHDLTLALDTLATMKIPGKVIINRADEHCSTIEELCRSRNIEILMKIPFSEKIAEGYSQGRSLLSSAPELKPSFEKMLKDLGAL